MNGPGCLSAAMAVLLVACTTPSPTSPSATPDGPSGASADPGALKPVSAFAGIRKREERSAALFAEAGRVLQHPRCLNCHPREPMPTQGDDLHAHVPMMQATQTGHGVPALQCDTCHQPANVSTHLDSIASIPGHAHWTLAPASMAWQGLGLREICEQIKDPARNGGRSLQAIHEHLAGDSLVGWAWHPGDGRSPAPGSQQELGELISAWIEAGAACPA